MTASTPQPERDIEPQCKCYHPTNCSICARKPKPIEHRRWCPSAPSEPPTVAQEDSACTCGEFAGTSVRYADCPVHCPPADAPERQDDEPYALEPPLEGLSDDDVLADLHAKWHCEPGNLMGPDDCGWEGCEVYAILQAVVPALASRRPAEADQ